MLAESNNHARVSFRSLPNDFRLPALSPSRAAPRPRPKSSPATISQDGRTGRGECVPYRRYGETMESVAAAIESVRAAIEDGCDRDALLGLLPAGAARNALDCALVGPGGKTVRANRRQPDLQEAAPAAIVTAYTLSLGTPEAMAAQARANADAAAAQGQDRRRRRHRAHPGGGRAPRPAAASSSTPMKAGATTTSAENLAAAAELGVALIEQPLPAGRDAILRSIAHPVPICADESVHTADDLPALAGLYDAVNIKLDKAGGLTAALQLRDAARARRLRASWSAAWSARRSPWRRPCCWPRAPSSPISTGRCCSPATARRRWPTGGRWCHRPTPALWG